MGEVEFRQTAPAKICSAWLQRIRLWSGAFLFFYLVMHLINIALGIFSLETMEAGRTWLQALIRNPLATVLLYGSFCVHIVLALWSLYGRHHLRIPFSEAIQILFGLVIPFFLTGHIVGSRMAYEWFGTTDSYSRLIFIFWESRPEYGVRQAVFLVFAWIHGCIALHCYLKLKSWYPRFVIQVMAIALLLPVLALIGFSQAGQEVHRFAQDSGWLTLLLESSNAPDPSESAFLEKVDTILLGIYGFFLCLVLIARWARYLHRRRLNSIRINYPGGKAVVVPAGFTVLDASRQGGIPHVSVCGGRGRCSTCRVRVTQGIAALPPSTKEEQRVLNHVGAPPNVRLACQLRPTHDLSVIPLLPVRPKLGETIAHGTELPGQERDIVVLFADLRSFTQIAEHKLPYDVVFLLNRYFDVVGEAVETSGGIANQFTGDGVMALFGIKTGLEEGCRQALMAAWSIANGMDRLNQELKAELQGPLRLGIGIHAGPAVVGYMGRGMAKYLTAVGDTVHVASRLEELTKEYGCLCIISEHVADRADIKSSVLPRYQLIVRNRNDPIVIRAIMDIQVLKSMLGGS
jgi:adenylate cyclase